MVTIVVWYIKRVEAAAAYCVRHHVSRSWPAPHNKKRGVNTREFADLYSPSPGSMRDMRENMRFIGRHMQANRNGNAQCVLI